MPPVERVEQRFRLRPANGPVPLAQPSPWRGTRRDDPLPDGLRLRREDLIGHAPAKNADGTEHVEVGVFAGHRFDSVCSVLVTGASLRCRVELDEVSALELIQVLAGDRKRCAHGFRVQKGRAGRCKNGVVLRVRDAELHLEDPMPRELASRLQKRSEMTQTTTLVPVRTAVGMVHHILTEEEHAAILRRSQPEHMEATT